MKEILSKWQRRIEYSEKKLKEIYEFKNTEAGIVIVDCNYWTFGDLPEKIPDDYYTDPKSPFKYQTDRIEQHFSLIQDDLYIPFLHPWYGTGVLASAFGVNIICNPKADPAVDLSTMKSPEEIDDLTMPTPGESGAMKIVTEMLDYFRDNSDLPVVFTDCQGPLTTAFQIVGYDKFCYWMNDDPKRIHKLMEMVTNALIDWVSFQKKRANAAMKGCCYPLSIKVPEGYGGVWVSDDDSVIMSGDLYAEFVKPYNEMLLKAFGGGCIHYCGNSTQNIDNYCNTAGVTAINNFNIDNLEAAGKIRKALREKGIVYMACDFVPADNRLEDYYKELIKAMDGSEGLIICPYVAPAVALERGQYKPASRDRKAVSKHVHEIIQREIS
jgi:hypothetical protein